MIRPDDASTRILDGPYRAGQARPEPTTLRPLVPEPGIDPLASSLELETSQVWISRAGRRNLQEKLLAGLVGIKHAIRGDSSFFAHAYRALLIFLTAGMIGVPPIGWCMLVIGLGLVLIAELGHSAIDTLARAIGDPDEPPLKMARDIAAAGVLVAVVISAAISITVLTLKLGEYLGWWERISWDGH